MTPGRVLTDADLNFHTCLQESVAWGPLKVKGRYARPAGAWTPRGAQPPGGRRDSIFRVKAQELASLDEAGWWVGGWLGRWIDRQERAHAPLLNCSFA